MELNSKVALITGAARRVGREIALTLAQAGCDVAVHCHRSYDDAEETARRIREMGRQAAVFTADLEDADAANTLSDRVVAEMGRIDVLVNNASIFPHRAALETDAALWQRVCAVNLIGPALLTQSAGRWMKANGGGRVVNITDILAERPIASYAAYCATKAALASLTIGMARALAPEVTVNAVAPGVAEFPDDFDVVKRARIVAHVPMQRQGSAEEVAATVLFLVRDGDYVTGSSIAVDGGRVLVW